MRKCEVNTMEIKLWENNIPNYLDGVKTPNMMTTYFVDTDKPLPCIVIYPHGKHGLGLALEREDIRPSADLAADWVERNI